MIWGIPRNLQVVGSDPWCWMLLVGEIATKQRIFWAPYVQRKPLQTMGWLVHYQPFSKSALFWALDNDRCSNRVRYWYCFLFYSLVVAVVVLVVILLVFACVLLLLLLLSLLLLCSQHSCCCSTCCSNVQYKFPFVLRVFSCAVFILCLFLESGHYCPA